MRKEETKILTPYGKAIKHRLIDMDMSQKELAKKISNMTGLFCDTALINKVCTGHNSNPKIVEALNDFLEINGIS